jgi:hypothetical protein
MAGACCRAVGLMVADFWASVRNAHCPRRMTNDPRVRSVEPFAFRTQPARAGPDG